MRRELRLQALCGLDRDNHIAGQICDSCHYSDAIAVSSSTLAWKKKMFGEGGVEEQGSRANEGDIPASSAVRIVVAGTAISSYNRAGTSPRR